MKSLVQQNAAWCGASEQQHSRTIFSSHHCAQRAFLHFYLCTHMSKMRACDPCADRVTRCMCWRTPGWDFRQHDVLELTSSHVLSSCGESLIEKCSSIIDFVRCVEPHGGFTYWQWRG